MIRRGKLLGFAVAARGDGGVEACRLLFRIQVEHGTALQASASLVEDRR